jgi:hypothetical protein
VKSYKSYDDELEEVAPLFVDFLLPRMKEEGASNLLFFFILISSLVGEARVLNVSSIIDFNIQPNFKQRVIFGRKLEYSDGW